MFDNRTNLELAAAGGALQDRRAGRNRDAAAVDQRPGRPRLPMLWLGTPPGQRGLADRLGQAQRPSDRRLQAQWPEDFPLDFRHALQLSGGAGPRGRGLGAESASSHEREVLVGLLLIRQACAGAATSRRSPATSPAQHLSPFVRGRRRGPSAPIRCQPARLRHATGRQGPETEKTRGARPCAGALTSNGCRPPTAARVCNVIGVEPHGLGARSEVRVQAVVGTEVPRGRPTFQGASTVSHALTVGRGVHGHSSMRRRYILARHYAADRWALLGHAPTPTEGRMVGRAGLGAGEAGRARAAQIPPLPGLAM